MEKIEHTTVTTNGIQMHVASIGSGPVVLFLHGFPELWYSWRHQLLSLSSLGYRAIAPDLRGYGDTDAPPSPSSYSAIHIVGDLVGLLDALAIDQVFLVGHDWGAAMAWYFCLLRPDRVKALVNLSVVFHPRRPNRKPVQTMRAILGDDYYICRFQKPGEAEEEFARAGTAVVKPKQHSKVECESERKPFPVVEPVFCIGDKSSGKQTKYRCNGSGKRGYNLEACGLHLRRRTPINRRRIPELWRQRNK